MTRTSQRTIRPAFEDLEGRQLLSVTLPETSIAAPAIITFRDPITKTYMPYIAWTGTDPQHHLNIENLFTGVKRTLPDTSSAAPALAVYHGRLFIAWTGTDPQHHLNVESSTDGMTFGHKHTLSVTTPASDGPALATYHGALYIAWTGTNLRLKYAFASDALGNYFGPVHTLSASSMYGPSLFTDNQLIGDGGIVGFAIAWTDMHNNETDVYSITSQHSSGSLTYTYSKNTPSEAVDVGFPDSPAFGNAWTDGTTGAVDVASESLELDFLTVEGSSPYGPSLAEDFIVDNHHYYVAWTGLDGHLDYDVV
jgi:hypothetical protein